MVRVNQIIKTIQGELRGIGFPIILLRFSGCNLTCSWCDAYEASHQEITKISNAEEILRKIEEKKGNISSILITGGEPFLYLNEENKEFFRKISQMFFNVIIETNGFMPDKPETYEPEYLKRLFPGSIVRIDCSPKVNLDAYRKYDNVSNLKDIYRVYDKVIPIIMKNQNYIIKMVYKPEYEDIILEFRQRYNIPHYNFCVLPYTPIVKDRLLNEDTGKDFLHKFRDSCRKTVEFCLNNDIIFSPREHIFLYMNDSGEHEDII